MIKVEDEVLTVGKVSKLINLEEGKIKFAKKQMRMIYDYIAQDKHPEPLNFIETAKKNNDLEYLELRNVLAADMVLNQNKAQLNGSQERLQNYKKLLRNPKIK